MIKPRIWISKIKLNDGTEISLEKNDILVFVGANNCGKSASLREINQLLTNTRSNTNIVIGIEIEKEGDVVDLMNYIDSVSKKSYKHPQNPHYQGFEFSGHDFGIKSIWGNYKTGLLDISNIFIKLLSTSDRLNVSSPVSSINLITESPQHPIHFLQLNDTLEIMLSDYFRQAFGMDLIVNRNAGNQVPLHIGKRPIPIGDEDRLSISYSKKIMKLPLLNRQGDGMRSFTGVLLFAFISNYTVLLIDEPEAFLHPPQARLIGKMLGKDLPLDRQLILATHSEDFLKGLLDSGNKKIKVIRINREGDINKAHLLDENNIKDIWQDPLLRHSNILNGLFHTKVVICESDSDCRFYSAVLYSLFEDKDEINPDILFVHCGGIDRIPVAIRALKKLGVPLQVITDFDVLNKERTLTNILIELGATWDELKGSWRSTKTAIDSKGAELRKDEVKSQLDTIFSAITVNTISKDKIDEINKLLKKASPWTYAKTMGKTFIPSGDPTKAFDELNKRAIEIGLNIVELGELESFDRSIGNHGSKWVNEVLKKDLNDDTALKAAREFVKRLI